MRVFLFGAKTDSVGTMPEVPVEYLEGDLLCLLLVTLLSKVLDLSSSYPSLSAFFRGDLGDLEGERGAREGDFLLEGDAPVILFVSTAALIMFSFLFTSGDSALIGLPLDVTPLGDETTSALS